MKFQSNRDNDQGMWDRRAMHCPMGVSCVIVRGVWRFRMLSVRVNDYNVFVCMCNVYPQVFEIDVLRVTARTLLLIGTERDMLII